MGRLKNPFLLAVPLAIFGAAGWWIYQQRPRQRVAGHEELEDPAVAAAYGRIASWPQMRALRYIVARNALSLAREGRAIDLGCGPGHLAILLARQVPGLQITGVDLAGEMLTIAAANVREAGLAGQIDFRKGDAARIPFEDASVDLVVSTLSLHHWREPVKVLNEINRVLRPRGAFLIFDLRRDMPAPAYLLIWFATHFVVPAGLRQANEPLNSRHAAYSLEEARQLAAQSRLSGWEVVPGPLWLFIQGKTFVESDNT
jgi:ubiquinone/menaquinone biosynthesis C-methylase UbiE